MRAKKNAPWGWRKMCGVFIVGFLFALGSAHADTGKGKAAKLTPLPVTPVQAPPVPVPVVVAEPTAKEPTCVWTQRSTVNYAPGVVVVTPGMLVSVCGCCGPNQVWLPGVFASVPASEQTTTEYQSVCQ